MAKRIARSEFYYEEARQRWRKRVKDPRSGKWINVYGRTKAECRERAGRRQAELDAESSGQSGLLMYQYARDWYRVNSAGVAERTKQGYANNINNHICPVIGGMPLADVTSDDVARVISVAAEKGLAKESQKKIISLLKKIFDAAEESGKIERSPCRRLKPKGRAPAKKKALTRAQQQTVVNELAGEPIQIFVLLALFCGLRREEALGLMWQDVHLDDPTPWLEVCRTCTWPHNQPVIEAYTKSAAGHRRLPIPDTLSAALRAEERTCDYVCHTSRGVPYSESAFRRAWAAVTDRCERTETYKVRTDGGAWMAEEISLKIGDKIPYKKDRVIAFDFNFTPHQLRHTYVTELIYAGVPLKTVQYLAGHAAPNITIAIYTDLIEHAPAETFKNVNESFKHFRDPNPGPKNQQKA